MKHPRLFSLLLALLAAGCGYDSGDSGNTTIAGYQWRSLYRSDVKTVAVPIFTNKSFQHGIEFQISNALIHKIESATPYKVVSRDHADTILEGEVVGCGPTLLSLSPITATPQEQLMTITVDFSWKDLRTGKIIVQRSQFEETASYYPTLGEGQYIGTQSASERLADAIVHEMEAVW